VKGYGSLLTVLEPRSLAQELIDDGKALAKEHAAVLRGRRK